MYSGFISSKYTINWLGAHQKFNRSAYSLVSSYIDPEKFPILKTIQKFEGICGPDGLKTKSAGKAEPSHFYNPLEGVGSVLEHISNHYEELVNALKNQDLIRAGFEASWLAHALCDGLTPAHHHALEDHICGIHGNAREVRRTRDKVLLRGETIAQTVSKTVQLMGFGGPIMRHVHFELGVAATAILSGFKTRLESFDLVWARHLGPLNYFKEQALKVDKLSMYDKFCQKGWTFSLANNVRDNLAPTITETIASVWLMAYQEALGEVELLPLPEAAAWAKDLA